jgi:hypothetical protein
VNTLRFGTINEYLVRNYKGTGYNLSEARVLWRETHEGGCVWVVLSIFT